MAKPAIDFQSVFSTIKAILKSKGLSYKDLAQGLGMSESGVKKLFCGKDCSFNRLLRICEWIEVPLGDILQSLHASSAKEVEFTPKQQAFFLRNMDCFRFFWKLVYERWPLSRIQSYFKLTDRQQFHYLKMLDEVGLVELHPGNRVKLPRMEMVRWMGNGPLLRHIRQEWSAELIGEVLRADIREDQHFSLRSYQLTMESFHDLLAAARALDLEFGRRAIREMSLCSDRVKQVRMVSSIAPGSFVTGLAR